MRSAIPYALAAASALSMGLAHAADVGPSPPAPRIWQPGIVSGPLHDSAPAFTPDGRHVYFGRSGGADTARPTLYVSERAAIWSPPEIASFSGRFSDMEPAMAPDGSHLIFVSNRPIVKGGALLDGHFNNRDFPAQGGALWRVDRTIGGWSEPQRLPDSINTPQGASFAPAIAADGSLYFMRSDPQSGRFRLYRSSWSASGYGAPEPLSFSTGASTDVDPAVAPDQSFLVFGSGPARAAVARGMDLFIVFRRADGGWGRPVHLGERVNAPGSDAEARLSPDHRTLFFSSERKTAHHPDAPWNNGLYNIWSMSLRSRMMAELKHRSLSEASGGH